MKTIAVTYIWLVLLGPAGQEVTVSGPYATMKGCETAKATYSAARPSPRGWEYDCILEKK